MRVFSFDAETDGLWGNPFSVAAIVYDKGEEAAKCCYRLSNDIVTNNWVIENVLPTLDFPVTHKSYKEMLLDFAAFYLAHKQGSHIICHMGVPVEAHLFREMHRIGVIGDWDGPYPLLDIAGNLQQVGEDPTSVDTYARKHNLEISYNGSTHNPLYDCEVAAKVFFHLQNINHEH